MSKDCAKYHVCTAWEIHNEQRSNHDLSSGNDRVKPESALACWSIKKRRCHRTDWLTFRPAPGPRVFQPPLRWFCSPKPVKPLLFLPRHPGLRGIRLFRSVGSLVLPTGCGTAQLAVRIIGFGSTASAALFPCSRVNIRTPFWCGFGNASLHSMVFKEHCSLI